MAIEALEARGVSIGGKKVRFELVAEDDEADPKQGTAVAQNLADLKVNGVVGHLTSGTSTPGSTIYSDAGRSRPRRPTRSSRARASRRRFASSPMTCVSAARSAGTP